MTGKSLHLIFVGKLKQRFLQTGCDLYLERLGHWRKIHLDEVRDAAKETSQARNLEEGRQLLKALAPQDLPIVLDERGEQMSSQDLANLLKRIDDNNLGCPCFLIGGPFGLSQEVRARAWKLLSLSSMTLPHELARLILLEQLYRAESILHRVPYHH
ncbi:MAG: 23S rRNA (pseudouridine(1915)-N(3))-methyltransferase RlmH [Desulfovibrio sp.]|nr:23S rRNA (pseudouridine(1915)-N(3))-methyltransferase RlmH [Desulfovibrio sp.]